MVVQLLKRLLSPKKKSLRKVLIVDPEDSLRELLTVYLESMDCEVQTLSSPVEAVRLLESGEQFRLTVISLVTQTGTALPFVKKLREIKQAKKLPAILIGDKVPHATLNGISEQVERLEVMTKPIKMKLFRELVEEALRTGFSSGKVSEHSPR